MLAAAVQDDVEAQACELVRELLSDAAAAAGDERPGGLPVDGVELAADAPWSRKQRENGNVVAQSAEAVGGADGRDEAAG